MHLQDLQSFRLHQVSQNPPRHVQIVLLLALRQLEETHWGRKWYVYIKQLTSSSLWGQSKKMSL